METHVDFLDFITTDGLTGAGELLVDSGWCGCQSEVVGHIWRPSQRSQVTLILGFTTEFAGVQVCLRPVRRRPHVF